MIRLYSILASIGLIYATALTPKIKDSALQNATTTALAVVAAAVTNNASKKNPDGTPADLPYDPAK